MPLFSVFPLVCPEGPPPRWDPGGLPGGRLSGSGQAHLTGLLGDQVSWGVPLGHRCPYFWRACSHGAQAPEPHPDSVSDRTGPGRRSDSNGDLTAVTSEGRSLECCHLLRSLPPCEQRSDPGGGWRPAWLLGFCTWVFILVAHPRTWSPPSPGSCSCRRRRTALPGPRGPSGRGPRPAPPAGTPTRPRGMFPILPGL